jgi:hypothetical protein
LCPHSQHHPVFPSLIINTISIIFWLQPPSSVPSAHPTTRALKFQRSLLPERAKSSCSTKSNPAHIHAHDVHAPDQIHHHVRHLSIQPSILSLWHLSWVLRVPEAPRPPTSFLDLCEHKAGTCFVKHASSKTSSTESRQCLVLHLRMAAPHSHCSAAAVRWQSQQHPQTPFAQ